LQKERTLAARAVYDGIGLHSGRRVHMELAPAPPGTGILFGRAPLRRSRRPPPPLRRT